MDSYYKKYYYRGGKCSNCSRPLTIKNTQGKCTSCRMIGNKRGEGMVITSEHRVAISHANSAENNKNWKGSSVKYGALHTWVKRRIVKPDVCPKCKEKKSILDLANKGIYDRNLNNWEYLCRKCHMETDGRLKKLIKRNAIKKSV